MDVFGAVVTTGIYCRPGCGATPLPRNITSFAVAAAAEAAGYRACLRCRPYRFPQPVGWEGSELVCRAVRLVLAGALDGSGEEALASRLGVSARHLRRLFVGQLGATPDELARSNRAHFARRLLDDTDLPVTEIAFAAGYGSVRQLNRSFQQVFRASPSQLRARRRVRDWLVADGGLPLRLSYRGPLDWPRMARWLAATEIPGVEHVDNETYRRTIMVDGDPGVIELMPGEPDSLRLIVHLPHWGGLIHIARRARQIAALDEDMTEAVGWLRSDPVLAPLLRDRPGIRVPGTWDPFETGVLAIMAERHGQGGMEIAGRLARGLGRPVPGLRPFGLTHTFPSARAVAGADLARTAGLKPEVAVGVRSFAAAVLNGRVRLDRSMALDELLDALTASAGVGRGAAQCLAWRMGERDAFPLTPATSPWVTFSAVWRPWRALACAQLQAAGPGPLGPLQPRGTVNSGPPPRPGRPAALAQTVRATHS